MDDLAPSKRPDGKVYCCASLGYVDLETFFDHHWETSRAFDDDTLVRIEPEAPDSPPDDR
jgi:hypothetical protein